jgi:hypothetical protein
VFSGASSGALLTGAGIGALALLVTSSLVIAIIAAFIALLFALFVNLPAERLEAVGWRRLGCRFGFRRLEQWGRRWRRFQLGGRRRFRWRRRQRRLVGRTDHDELD